MATGTYKTGSSTFFAPVKVLSRYFRRRFLEQRERTWRAGKLKFPEPIARYRDPKAFKTLCDDARGVEWNVYAKQPFAGPKALLRYLSRYTHRVAIGNSRLTAFDGTRVSFRYRKPVRKAMQKPGYAVMTLSGAEFIRRYLLHVLPRGFHRIRNFGILANSKAAATIEAVKAQTGFDNDAKPESAAEAFVPACTKCQSPMKLVLKCATYEALFNYRSQQQLARAPPALAA